MARRPRFYFDDEGHCIYCKLDRIGVIYGERAVERIPVERVFRNPRCNHVTWFRGGNFGPRNLALEDQARKDRREVQKDEQAGITR